MDAHQPELFERGPAAPVDVAPEAEASSALAKRVPGAIRLGTSSWSFPGWAGRVYDRVADARTLARQGLGAYARHPLLRTVGVDRAYYESLPERAWAEYAAAVPDDFRFVVKAERVLVTPGEPAFLDASVARDRVVGPVVAGLGHKLGAILFQFPPTPPSGAGGPRRFAERLYHFLRALPEDVPKAVEIRTPAWYTADYLAALRHGGAAHGWVLHPRMSSLDEQRALGPPGTEGPTIIRWMLAPGATYEGAREAWAPFDRLRAPDPSAREATARLALEAARAGRAVFVVINNKAEGSAPASIEALADRLARFMDGTDGGAASRGDP
jgi:uncharacterized protein YecE (DUF72 family)